MELDANTPINLQLPLGAVNLVLSALQKLPYESVAGLIGDIHKQAGPQVMAAQEQPTVESAAN